MSVTPEQLEANKVKNRSRRIARQKPGWPTVVRKTTARGMAYLQRRELTPPFSPDIRVMRPKH